MREGGTGGRREGGRRSYQDREHERRVCRIRQQGPARAQAHAGSGAAACRPPALTRTPPLAAAAVAAVAAGVASSLLATVSLRGRPSGGRPWSGHTVRPSGRVTVRDATAAAAAAAAAAGGGVVVPDGGRLVVTEDAVAQEPGGQAVCVLTAEFDACVGNNKALGRAGGQGMLHKACCTRHAAQGMLHKAYCTNSAA